ncbi:MAG: hypothetical protein MJ153_05940 [Clostridia bacterium]|nr:hypothetical protein [Clostridia bacterium]
MEISVPESKSVGHRDLIVNFLTDTAQGTLRYNETYPITVEESDSNDIRATKNCINALVEAATAATAAITATGNDAPGEIILPAEESGSTLRFFIPVGIAVLDKLGMLDTTSLVFTTGGRLFERPLDDIKKCLEPHGVTIIHDNDTRTIKIVCKKSHLQQIFEISGRLSSQNISGLLMALPLLEHDSQICITEEFNSKTYVDLTTDVLCRHGVNVEEGEMQYEVAGNSYLTAKHVRICDGDWSSGAFLLCMKGLISDDSELTVSGLNYDSPQGDRAITDFLEVMAGNAGNANAGNADAGNADKGSECISYNCKNIPDIVPYMAIYAAYKNASNPNKSTRLLDVGRLKHKESDRISAVLDYLQKIGARSKFDGDNLTVYGADLNYIRTIDELKVSSYNDHRMAMTAFMLALGAGKIIDIDDIDCMAKSFPMLPAIMKREFGI